MIIIGIIGKIGYFFPASILATVDFPDAIEPVTAILIIT